MATNKRKDAAALFELIDKSTLKVPKTAGGLKIPSWWSSKSNPPANDSPSAPAAPTSRPDAPSSNGHASPHAALAPPEPPSADSPAQPRLFEPPPSHLPPTSTPSIRPPSASVPIPVSPAVKSPPPATASALAAAEEDLDTATPPVTPRLARSAGAATSAPTDAPPPPPGPRLFAPQTRAQSRRPWSPPRPGAFARLPSWVLFGGLTGIIIIVCCVVWLARHRDSASAKATPSAQTATPTSAYPPGRSLLPPPGTSQTVSRNQKPASPASPRSGELPRALSSASVHEPGTVTRSPDLFYILICQTPLLDIAQRNARFIADRGVDVSIEITDVKSGRPIYGIYTVDGYKSQSEAKPHVDDVVHIGQELKEAFHTGGRGFNDAVVQRVRKPAAVPQ